MIPLAHVGTLTAYRADVRDPQVSGAGTERFAAVTPGDRGQFAWMGASEPRSLYCADETDPAALRVCAQLSEGLLAYDAISGAIVPALAQACVPVADLTIWTCTLRSGVTFHDGAALDANDVVLSFAVQWDADHPLHRGRTGTFQPFQDRFGGFLNPPATQSGWGWFRSGATPESAPGRPPGSRASPATAAAAADPPALDGRRPVPSTCSADPSTSSAKWHATSCPARDLAQRRIDREHDLRVAQALAQPAAGVEPAARRRVDGRRDVAAEDDPAPAGLDDRIRDRDRREQRDRVRDAADGGSGRATTVISTIRPRYMTAIRSLMWATTERSCATNR